MRALKTEKNRGFWLALLAGAVLLLGWPVFSRAGEEAKAWEQLFFPFPIVGAPPQLEQQVQVFAPYFTGSEGRGFEPSAELGYIATSRIGVVATLPYQSGSGGQPTGVGDFSFLIQYLAAGSLEHDNMLSAGIETVAPTGVDGFSEGDYLTGPFVYGAQRFFKHLIFEGNVTALVPVEHASTAKQVLLNGLVSYLMTPADASFPIYLQTEVDATFYYSGSESLPPNVNSAPAQTLFLAPEVFLGPFATPISDGTRVAGGVFFNVVGDSVHERTYELTFAFDIPNRFGY